MPGKLRTIPGKTGRYYRRRDGAYSYQGHKFSKYTPSLDKQKTAQHKHRPGYPHEGDTSKRLRL